MLGRGALVFIWVPPEDALAFKAYVIIDGRDTSIAVVWTHIGPYLVPPCYLTAKEQKHVLRAVVYSLMQSAIVERRIYVFLALSEFVRMELLKASELDLCESMLCLQIEAYLALAKTQGDAWTIDATLSCGKLGESERDRKRRARRDRLLAGRNPYTNAYIGEVRDGFRGEANGR